MQGGCPRDCPAGSTGVDAFNVQKILRQLRVSSTTSVIRYILKMSQSDFKAPKGGDKG